jgi:hypothetical protein
MFAVLLSNQELRKSKVLEEPPAASVRSQKSIKLLVIHIAKFQKTKFANKNQLIARKYVLYV